MSQQNTFRIIAFVGLVMVALAFSMPKIEDRLTDTL